MNSPTTELTEAVQKLYEEYAKTVKNRPNYAEFAFHAGYKAALATRERQATAAPLYVTCRECHDCGHIGINDESADASACSVCEWHGPSPTEDQCPSCETKGSMISACPKCSSRYRSVAEATFQATAAPALPVGEVVALQHMAVAENGVLRWMSGRKMQDCELYAMPDGGNAPKLYATPPAPPADTLSDERIASHLTDMLAQRDFPPDGVSSYWLTANEIRELFARAILAAGRGVKSPTLGE